MLHLVVNMLALLSFGPALERAWGHGKFLLCYVVAAVVAGILQSTISNAPCVGASAALFALFTAWVCANPRKRVISIIPWPLQAWQVLLVYAAASAAALAFGWLAGIAHAAHLAGMVIGFGFATNNKAR